MYFQEFCTTLGDRKKLLDYCFAVGLLNEEGSCPTCAIRMSLQGASSTGDGVTLRCPKCKRKVSVRAGTFIENSNLPLETILSIIYLLKLDVLNSKIAEVVGVEENVVGRIALKLREAYSRSLHDDNEQLGGEGVIVHVDECLLAKSKLTANRHGRPVSDRWVFGIYDTEKKYGIIRFIPDRTRETLHRIIVECCAPGTIIHSDGWAAYG